MRAKFGRGPSRNILTIDNPLNPPGVGWVNFLKVRVSIRTCVPKLGAVRRERFLTIENPLTPPGMGWRASCQPLGLTM